MGILSSGSVASDPEGVYRPDFTDMLDGKKKKDDVIRRADEGFALANETDPFVVKVNLA